MGIVSLNCPNCGGKLQMDDSLEKGYCQYCGGEVIIKKDNITNVTNNVTNNNISNSNVTIINDKNKEFEIKACELQKYNGESDVVIIPDGVKTIGMEAFYELAITKVICPKSLVKIDESAFESCTSLKKIELPDSLEEIGFGAFNGCTALEEITFPENLKKIGWYAFKNCMSLKKIKLPKDIEVIDFDAFEGCIALEEIKLPDGLKEIGGGTFQNCTSLKEVELPESLEKIGDKAFYNCSSLEKITFGSNLKNVTFSAFEGCTNLKNIKLPKSMDQNILKSLIDYFKAKPGVVVERPDKDGGKTYKSTKSGCYVATCVYGSYDCPEVWTLRRFRDSTLANTFYGRIFIKIYYATSPTVVKLFGNTKWFKKMWKGKLDKLVEKLQNDGVESTPYQDIEW